MMNSIVVVLFSIPQLSQAQFKLGAEIRPRAEFRNGFKTPKIEGAQPAFFIEQRSRLYFDYKTEKFIKYLNEVLISSVVKPVSFNVSSMAFLVDPSAPL